MAMMMQFKACSDGARTLPSVYHELYLCRSAAVRVRRTISSVISSMCQKFRGWGYARAGSSNTRGSLAPIAERVAAARSTTNVALRRT